MNSIPASQIVSVRPGVLGAGGNPLSLNGVFLTENASAPIGLVLPFATLEDVQNYFGINSLEAAFAAVYFGGFTNSLVVPGLIYFAQYNATAAAAYLRSASLAGLTLTQLQALSGTIVVAVNGATVTSAAINLAGATSFSNAATLIQAGLQTVGGIFNGTGTVTNGNPTLTINTTVAGRLHIGDTVVGTDIPAATTITAFGTYDPNVGTGTVTMSANATGAAGPETITASSAVSVSYDAQLDAFVVTSPTTGVNSSVGYAAVGALATGLKLTQAAGAVLSLGAAAATPASVMAAVVLITQNWATFTTTFEPVLDDKLAFAAWVQTTNQRYAYVCWDSDPAALAANASGSFGALTADDNGVVAVWNPDGSIAAFICGCAASIDYSATNARITFAFKNQAGLTPDVTDATVAANLIGNGYNFYGAYATANQQFQFLQPGQISGDWNWIDPYINQIYLNSQLQLAFMELLVNTPSLPYNNEGYGLIRAAAMDPINEALNNGSIRAGVALSAAQAQEVNTAAGLKISGTLQTSGFYLLIQPATALTRQNRQSPPMTLWYTDGGSIQKINLASIDVE